MTRGFYSSASGKKQNIIVSTSKKQCDSTLGKQSLEYQYCSYSREAENALTLTQFQKERGGGEEKRGKKLRNTVVPSIGNQSASQFRPYVPAADHKYRPKQCFTKNEKLKQKFY